MSAFCACIYLELFGFFKSGAETRKTDAFSYPHDIIKFTLRCKENIFAISKEFYDLGCNLKEIARLTGFARTSIRTALIEGGVVLRKFDHDSLNATKKPKASSNGVAPFGYYFHKNILIKDLKEYKVVQAIIMLWLKGTTMKAIATHLNDNKISTRHSTKWNIGLIKLIIKRNKTLIKN